MGRVAPIARADKIRAFVTLRVTDCIVIMFYPCWLLSGRWLR